MRRFAGVAVVVLLAWGVISGPAAAQSRLSVEYRSPRLTIRADEVPLAEVLARVARVVGFEVVGHAPDTLVSVTLEDVSIEDALRRLLRGASHSLVYRAPDPADPSAGLDRLVLVSSSRRVPGDNDGRSRPPSREAITDGPQPSEIASAPVMPAVPAWTPVWPEAPAPAAPSVPSELGVPVPYRSEAAPPQIVADPEATGVAGLLRSHAIAGMPAAPSRAPHVSPPVHPDLSAALAETTRRAHLGVSNLVDALANATRALEDAQAASK